LLERQRNFAAQQSGAVLDGRDIGTVIAPDATAKLFVTASAEVRARRRLGELLARGIQSHLADVLIDIRARDERDSGRDAAPLRQAGDADLLDTSDMDIDQAIAAAIELVGARIAANA
jgi:cytidylate kinase